MVVWGEVGKVGAVEERGPKTKIRNIVRFIKVAPITFTNVVTNLQPKFTISCFCCFLAQFKLHKLILKLSGFYLCIRFKLIKTPHKLLCFNPNPSLFIFNLHLNSMFFIPPNLSPSNKLPPTTHPSFLSFKCAPRL